MRLLTHIENEALKLLTEKGIEVTIIEPTKTGLQKSILDATAIVQSFLKRQNIHNYSIQKQGPEHKIILPTNFISLNKVTPTTASLYRPVTKSGDPRIWFKGLNNFANANDIIAIIAWKNELNLINISTLNIKDQLDNLNSNPLKELIQSINSDFNIIANELLEKLRNIAKLGPMKSLLNADTAVGRTLETCLGININSSKQPDYKGIEIKSFRDAKKNRKNLFAQVPDWNESKFKSSKEILENFGYLRGNDLKLYCTVNTKNRNPQGLILRLDSKLNRLFENSNSPNINDFVVWNLEKLHARLIEKHSETFWVSAKSSSINGDEYFEYTKVEHTKKPIISQFDILLEQGKIQLDHLIKQSADGKVVEKGPIFKLETNSIELLFPPSVKYNLLY